MSLNFLDFEQPIAELEAKIDSLTAVSRQDEKLDINLDEEVQRLREKSVELTRKIFSDLGAWQIAQLARHPRRPYTLDYIKHIFTDFEELAGDRAYADDKAIVGGIARLDGRAGPGENHVSGVAQTSAGAAAGRRRGTRRGRP